MGVAGTTPRKSRGQQEEDGPAEPCRMAHGSSRAIVAR